MDKKLLNILIAIAVIAVLAAVGVGFLSYKIGYSKGMETGRIAAQVKAGDAVKNPLEKMPETNPFEKVANPFEEAYKNPFK